MLTGFIPLAIAIVGMFMFHKLPVDLRESLSDFLCRAWSPYVVVACAIPLAAFVAVGVVREIGHARLAAAVAFFRRLGWTGVLAMGALILPPLGSIVLFVTMGTTSEWLRSHGALGIAMYVVAFAVLAGLALLPTYAQSALGGFAFGVMWGAPAALAGFVGGAVIAYFISKRAAGDRVEKIIEEKPKWRAVRDALVGTRGLPPARAFTKQLLMVSLLRLPPNSPFALTNLVMASVKIPMAPYVIGTAIGMFPRSTLAVVVGAGVQQALTREALDSSAPKWVWPVGIAVTLAIVALIGWIANRAIERVTRAQSQPEAAPQPSVP